jgi:hypothetical protein
LQIAGFENGASLEDGIILVKFGNLNLYCSAQRWYFHSSIS